MFFSQFFKIVIFQEILSWRGYEVALSWGVNLSFDLRWQDLHAFFAVQNFKKTGVFLLQKAWFLGACYAAYCVFGRAWLRVFCSVRELHGAEKVVRKWLHLYLFVLLRWVSLSVATSDKARLVPRRLVQMIQRADLFLFQVYGDDSLRRRIFLLHDFLNFFLRVHVRNIQIQVLLRRHHLLLCLAVDGRTSRFWSTSLIVETIRTRASILRISILIRQAIIVVKIECTGGLVFPPSPLAPHAESMTSFRV